MKLLAIFLLAAAIWLPPGDASPAEPAVKTETAELVEGNTAFAFRLYRELAGVKNNFCFSPYSISCLMAMPYLGADSGSAAELQTALNYPDRPETAFAALQQRFARTAEKEDVTLEFLSAIFLQEDIPPRADYRRKIEQFFAPQFELVDFLRRPADAVTRINAAAAEGTHGRITKIVDTDDVKNAYMVLLNCVYFLGRWESPFDRHFTRPEEFHQADGTSTPVPFMRQTANYRYAKLPYGQAIQLNYRPGDLSMLFLLPEPDSSLETLEQLLSAEEWAKVLQQLSQQKIDLFLPKFKLTSEMNLIPPLKALGLDDVFTPGKADFSGITDAFPLYIGLIKQKVFLEVDERGSEATVATAIGMWTGSVPRPEPPPLTLRLDRPFLYAIIDNATGMILFLGRIVTFQT